VTLTRTAVVLDNIRMYLWSYSESLPEIEDRQRTLDERKRFDAAHGAFEQAATAGRL
jgi:hypothetical protein